MFHVMRHWFGVLLLCTLFSYSRALKRFGSEGTTLYISNDPADKHYKFNQIFNTDIESKENQSNSGGKQNVPTSTNTTIQHSTNYLQDTHQQLIVHWVGKGSNVIICLAKDPPSRTSEVPPPSNLFISYDYGITFVNKTENFKIYNGSYAQLDKFSNHPKYTSHWVFLDSRNKVLFYSSDNLKTVTRTYLDFHPTEVSFDGAYPEKFVVLDKLNPSKQLYLTLDSGRTFTLIQEHVKSFFWSSTPPRMFYYERCEPNASSVILSASDPGDIHNSTSVLTHVQDFQIKGDFMFVTKKSEQKTLDLLISYKNGKFHKAVFQTELDLKKFFIFDVSNDRVLMAAMHSEKLTNLYVSDINANSDEFKFVLSLEGIMCYMPNSTWKGSMLDDIADEAFIDLHKVEGLKGIYIASKIEEMPAGSNLDPEHLVSVITYDYGLTWNPINPPEEDGNGMPIVCLLKNNCSLHLSQTFSHLYPVTRSADILTSKSVPGMILATGVVGKSLKGVVGLFISRDAGLTWKRILKDYHFVSFGDHGGVLTAVKYFETSDNTRTLLYSINEGETWDALTFQTEHLHMYGLLTEPGEHTTTFIMIGSMKVLHQWTIIKVDLLKAFPRNCTEDDYKFWSPSSAEADSHVPCILGETDTYQQRKQKAQCYIGLNYDRPDKKQVCQCSRHDFECDYGFVLSNDSLQCIRNNSHSLFYPYKIPANCSPEQNYSMTKGYRKIDSDVCVDGYASHYMPDNLPCPVGEDTEFLILASRNKIFRINLENNSTSIFPINDLKNVVAIEFDMKNSCIYWADALSKKIKRQCLNSSLYPEIFVGTLRNSTSIEGMALDWISNVLFFVDSYHAIIEAVRTDLSSQGRMRRTILGPDVLIKPRGIAVHPKAGYLYWSDWSPDHPSISRSNLDGTNIKKLFTKPIVQWPNGITIDRIAERIYWVDAREDYIGSADLHGMYFKKVLSNTDTVTHPFAIAILKDKMYWDDWNSKSLYEADKDSAINIKTIKKNLLSFMDLKVFAHYVQQGTNACTFANNTCKTLCLGAPMNSYSCLCPDGLIMEDNMCLCPGGSIPFSNMTCPQQQKGCPVEQFTCGNGICVPSAWRCDNDKDCGDGSDEEGCKEATLPCDGSLMIPCKTGNQCLPAHWQCDGDVDCLDGSDELGCKDSICPPGYFKCGDGLCINKSWICNGEKNCYDGSDERDCEHTTMKPATQRNCSSEYFQCVNDGKCLPKAWICDGENDCLDSSDEDPAHCRNNQCPNSMFRCTENGKCIYKLWVCDGDNDCVNGKASDEQNCTVTTKPNTSQDPSTSPTSFLAANDSADWKCSNDKCVPSWSKCDDCGDGTGEIGYAVMVNTSTEKVVQTTERQCSKNQFTCSPGSCISLSVVCDYKNDCLNGADEMNCKYKEQPQSAKHHCKTDMYACSDETQCVSKEKVCDGHSDCNDGSDEISCEHTMIKPATENNCSSESFKCVRGGNCVPKVWVCDGEHDCSDNSDEDPIYCRDYPCPDSMFRCTKSGKCINKSWVCDGEDDCVDGKASDEQNCTTTVKPNTPLDTSISPINLSTNNQCLYWMFRCSNGKCVPYWWKCDRENDCGDGSDEIGCVGLINTSTKKTVEMTQRRCSKNQFTCSPGICIPLWWVCDYDVDCPNRVDEVNCKYNETNRYHCKADMFVCSDEIQCVSGDKVCDGHSDCGDNSDETSCELIELTVDQSSINSTSFLFFWTVPQTKGVRFQFLPAIANAGSKEIEWRNATEWIDDSRYRFTGLEPYIGYNVTVFIRANKNGSIYSYPSRKFLNVTTSQGVPSPPTNVTACQLPEQTVEVQWNAPNDPNGVITCYTVKFTPPEPLLEITTTGTSVRIKGDFRLHVIYTFWVIAENSAFQSHGSEVSVLTYNGVEDVDKISNVTVLSSSETSVSSATTSQPPI